MAAYCLWLAFQSFVSTITGRLLGLWYDSRRLGRHSQWSGPNVRATGSPGRQEHRHIRGDHASFGDWTLLEHQRLRPRKMTKSRDPAAVIAPDASHEVGRA